MKRALLLAALLCLCAFAGGAGAADVLWPMLRGAPAGTGSAVWPGEAAPPEVREWHFTNRSSRKYEMGMAVWASPALAVIDGRPMAFIGGYDQTLHALDLAAKERLWYKITNGPIQAPPAVGRVDGSPVVFWTSADRAVYAHYALNGDRLWTRELVKATNTLGDTRLGAPLLHKGTLYVTCFAYNKALARNQQKGRLFALDMRSGRVLDHIEVSQGPVGSPVGREIGGAFRIFLCARKGLLQAIDVVGGRFTRTWDFQMAHEVLGSPVVQQQTAHPLLFLGSKFGNLVALDARTGKERWQQMAGNWIDNTACVGRIDGDDIVYVGSHDYNVYAFRAATGERLWRRRLGGEVYSAPAFFQLGAREALAVGALDNHVYCLDARTGDVIGAYFTGTPMWDKVSKGENVWGSPTVLQAGAQTAVVHGSFSNTVYVIPLCGECSLQAKVRSSADLWWGLLVTLVVFLGVILPVTLLLPKRPSLRA